MSEPASESLVPRDEEGRLRALRDQRILDTGREALFDRYLAQLAERLDVPIAYLSLIAEDRQWLKSKVGPVPTETRRGDAFCSRTILGDGLLEVADAALDPRFSESPLVREEPHVRFYAGVPITAHGHTIGTVCVAGQTPRKLDARERANLEGFAERVQALLADRPEAIVAYASDDEELISRFLDSDPRLRERDVLDLWSSRRAATSDAGDWKLEEAVLRARSAVLMLSPAFVRSVFVEDGNFRRLLEAREHEEFKTRVVLLEACDPGGVEWLANRALWPPSGRAVGVGSEEEIDARFRDLAIELLGEPPAAAGREPVAEPPTEARRQIFLSRRTEDADAAEEIARKLRQAGLEVFIGDKENIPVGDKWQQVLENELERSDAFAVYIGRSGITGWVGPEVDVALDRNTNDPRFRVIPILGPGADLETLSAFVKRHQCLDLREGDPKPEQIRTIVAPILRRPLENLPLLPPGVPPFLGLQSFGADDARIFFGRERETAELVEKLRAMPFLAVIGDSGSGKSSLVLAGLIPALRKGRFRDASSKSPTWRMAVIRPGSRPFGALKNGLLDLLADASPNEKLETAERLEGCLSEGAAGLRTALTSLVERGERTLLVVDQFEELFTQLPNDPDERDRFIDTLLGASRCEGERPLHTVITLRADFYQRCHEHPTLPKVLSTHYAVQAIARDRLPEVIEEPAKMAGIHLDPALVKVIQVDLAKDENPASLPLLQHTLRQLWEGRTGQKLTLEAYQEIGRVGGALEHHANEVYGRFDEAEKEAARKLFLDLVVPTETGGHARRRAKRSDLLPASDERATREAVLDRLVAERLLATRSAAPEAGGGDSDSEVEVSHEALLKNWKRLDGWLEEDRDFLWWNKRTRDAFEDWKAKGRHKKYALRAGRVEEARRWLETHRDRISKDGIEFLEMSLTLDRRRRLRLVALTVIFGVLAVVVFLFGQQAKTEQQRAEASLVTATEAVDEMLTKVGSESLRNVPQLEGVRAELLAHAEKLYEELRDQQSGAPGLRLQLALAPARMARLQHQMGRIDEARAGFGTAINELQKLKADQPDSLEYPLELAKLHTDVAWLITNSDGKIGDLEEAAASMDRAIAILEDLLKVAPANVDYATELTRGHLNRGIVRYRQYLQHLERGSRQKSGLEAAQAAEADYRDAIGYVERFEDLKGERYARARQQLGLTYMNRGNLFAEQGRNEEAAGAYKRAVQLQEALLGENEKNKTNREYKHDLAATYTNLAVHYDARGMPEEAVRYAGEARSRWKELADALPDVRRGWAVALSAYGIYRASQSDEAISDRAVRDQAIESLRESSRIFADLMNEEKALPSDYWQEAVTLLYLASLRNDANEMAELERVWKRLGVVLDALPPGAKEEIEGYDKFKSIQRRF